MVFVIILGQTIKDLRRNIILKNVGGFIVEEDIELREVAMYISNLPTYKRVKRKIDSLRKRLKNIKSEEVKFFIRQKIKELIEEKRKIMAVAFYERHKSKATMTIAALNKIMTFSKRNINKKNRSVMS